jgi:hypothetical protein
MKARPLLVAAALTAAGCSDDDAAGNDSTVVEPATTPTSAVNTTAPSSATTVTTETSPPTTDAPTTVTPTTTPPVDVEALKAEIARDYERAFYRGWKMLEMPSLRNLEARVAAVRVPGSPSFDQLVARIEELVALGDRVVPNDRDLLSVTVERVELVGRPPFRRAIVTVCEVTNRRQVTPAENSPTGNEIEVAGTGVLDVARYDEPVRLTDNGWLRYVETRRGTLFDQGETTCPPA